MFSTNIIKGLGWLFFHVLARNKLGVFFDGELLHEYPVPFETII